MKIDGIAAYGQISCSVNHFRFYEEIGCWIPKLIQVFGYVFSGNHMFRPELTLNELNTDDRPRTVI